jgi:hypothetical protein
MSDGMDKPPPFAVAALAVVGLAFVLYALAPIVAEFVGAYW